MNDNVTKTEFGYEVLWANTEHYSSRILVFDHIGSKTNMSFTKETTKSWFVNAGELRIRWIDTNTGKLYENTLREGSVFHVTPLMPVSLECLYAGSAIAETATKHIPEDVYHIIPADNIKASDDEQSEV
ncbi:MAG: hypothetical protein ACKVJK_00615 [Methylophagaceae bacterium]|jgi:hypothetical protein|tara:strand:+ start:8887 stop:9273 length:387 start_codon:yes stop_codon:yes gene_type:complete